MVLACYRLHRQQCWSEQSGSRSSKYHVPLVVLTGGKQFLVGARFYEVWLETQNSLADLSSESTHTVCSRCGHYVHKDNPGMVVDAITSVIEQARARSAGRKITRKETMHASN